MQPDTYFRRGLALRTNTSHFAFRISHFAFRFSLFAFAFRISHFAFDRRLEYNNNVLYINAFHKRAAHDQCSPK
jgi:hypothetical protein